MGGGDIMEEEMRYRQAKIWEWIPNGTRQTTLEEFGVRRTNTN
jgi:hypothetical protein